MFWDILQISFWFGITAFSMFIYCRAKVGKQANAYEKARANLERTRSKYNFLLSRHDKLEMDKKSLKETIQTKEEHVQELKKKIRSLENKNKTDDAKIQVLTLQH